MHCLAFISLQLFSMALGAACDAQSQDSLKQAAAPNADTAQKEEKAPDLTNTLILDFFISIDGSSFLNPQQSTQHDNFYGYTTLSLNNTANIRRVSVRAAFNSEYGIRAFRDSATAKAADQYEYQVFLDAPLSRKEWLRVQCGINVKSQFSKTYLPTDSGTKILFTDYFSPGYILYTAGFSFRFLESATFDIGLVGAQTTRIRNEEIYESRQTDELYGVPRGKRKVTELGINLILNIPPYRLGKHFGWACAGQMFAPNKDIGRLAGYTYSINNSLHYIFLKYMRLSLATQVAYDESVSNKVFLRNQLTLGFFLSNTL